MAEKHRFRKAVCRSLLWAACLAVPLCGAEAQLLGGLGRLPAVNGLGHTLQGTLGDLGNTAERGLGTLRDAVGRPLAAKRWQRDPQGNPIVRDEVVAVSPTPASLAAAVKLSFTVARTDSLEPLGLTVVVLHPPQGMTEADALAQLRAADPQGRYDFNHIYNPSGEAVAPSPAVAPSAGASVRIGMIDGGVDKAHSAFRGVRIETAGFVGDCKPLPSDHGTEVASLLAASRLYAADVFCGRGEGGSAEAIVRALGWLAAAKLPVVNVSLAGPPNALLAAGTEAFLKRGAVLVAAAGNDGPAAGERFPAAYPGVIAVTAVDAARRIELDAEQGSYIAFAAPGVKVTAAKAGGGGAKVTGTSFAAPLVAHRFALLLAAPNSGGAAWAVCVLRHQAVDLGAPGRDPVFGYGYLDATPPSQEIASPCNGIARQ